MDREKEKRGQKTEDREQKTEDRGTGQRTGAQGRGQERKQKTGEADRGTENRTEEYKLMDNKNSPRCEKRIKPTCGYTSGSPSLDFSFRCESRSVICDIFVSILSLVHLKIPI